MYPSFCRAVSPSAVSCPSLFVGARYFPSPGVLLYLSVLCQRPLENPQLARGLGRCCSIEVHATALNVGCEGQISAALLCLFHVSSPSPSWEMLKYTQTQKVRSAFPVCTDYNQIILTLLCRLLTKDSLKEWCVLMISLCRAQTIQWTVGLLLMTTDKDEFCQNPFYSNRDFTGGLFISCPPPVPFLHPH